MIRTSNLVLCALGLISPNLVSSKILDLKAASISDYANNLIEIVDDEYYI